MREGDPGPHRGDAERDRRARMGARSARRSRPASTVDYTSLFGGSAETLAADALIERWRAMGFDAEHLIGRSS